MRALASESCCDDEILFKYKHIVLLHTLHDSKNQASALLRKFQGTYTAAKLRVTSSARGWEVKLNGMKLLMVVYRSS